MSAISRPDSGLAHGRAMGRRRARALELLRRAATLRAVATCFADPQPGLRDRVLAGLSACATAGACAPEIDALAAAWDRCEEGAAREAHCRLFLGAAPCPPAETSWGDARRLGGQPADLADIRGFYRAFGFDLSPAARDMADHASVELEFLAALLAKAAYATLEGWTEQRDLTVDAARAFSEQHLGRWTRAFASKLREMDPGPPWAETADALEATVAAECRALGAEPTDAAAMERVGADAQPFTCPHASSTAEDARHA